MKRMLCVFLGVVLVAGCSGDDGEPTPDLCTPEETEKLVGETKMSTLLGSVDEASQSVLLDSIVKQCCAACPDGPNARPTVEVATACVQCAAGYSGGNPGEHITSCAEKVCSQ